MHSLFSEKGRPLVNGVFNSGAAVGALIGPVIVTFIGLGVMGRPMAANLLRAGYAVSFFSRRPETGEMLIDLGGVPAHSSREAAEHSDAIVTMLPDTAAVDSVLFGKDGVSEAILSDAVVIDMSTIAPAAAMDFAARFAAMGRGMLDAPVSGGEKGAIEGTLSIMVGREQRCFESARPILQAMGKSIVCVVKGYLFIAVMSKANHGFAKPSKIDMDEVNTFYWTGTPMLAHSCTRPSPIVKTKLQSG